MLRYLAVVLYCAMIAINYLANALPINNLTTGQISDFYPNLFVPVPLTFSIWGVIYLLLAVCCAALFMGKTRDKMVPLSLPFAITCIFNALWIVLWHYQQVALSVLIMAGLLITLIYINSRIKDLPFGLIKASFGIYLGWICIATISNITAWFVSLGWNGYPLSESIWAIIMILTGAGITIISIIRFRNPFIGLSVLWAFGGIILRRSEDYLSIVATSALAALLVAAVVIIRFYKQTPSVSN